MPAAPTGLNAVISNDLFVQLNWTNPSEANRGTTTAFEVGYVRTEEDCLRFEAIESNQMDCGDESVRESFE